MPTTPAATPAPARPLRRRGRRRGRRRSHACYPRRAPPPDGCRGSGARPAKQGAALRPVRWRRRRRGSSRRCHTWEARCRQGPWRQATGAAEACWVRGGLRCVACGRRRRRWIVGRSGRAGTRGRAAVAAHRCQEIASTRALESLEASTLKRSVEVKDCTGSLTTPRHEAADGWMGPSPGGASASIGGGSASPGCCRRPVARQCWCLRVAPKGGVASGM